MKKTTLSNDEVTVLPETAPARHLPVVRQLIILGALLLLLLGASITPLLFSFFNPSLPISETIKSEDPQDTIAQSDETETTEPFGDVRIQGKAAYVWDVQQQKALYKKDESKQLPLASITKLMTALLAQEILDESEHIQIDGLSIRQDGDSGLREGEVFDRLSLSDLVLMSSSNDGAFALAAAAGNALAPTTGAKTFVQAMNLRAQEIGLKETYFKNPTGLDISPSEGGAYGSARDVAFLMEYIVLNNPDILTFTRESEARVYSESGSYHDAENTNYYIDQIPGLIGSKTGYTDLAGGNLVVAFNAGLNRPIIAVVLGSTQQERFTDMIKLIEDAQEYVSHEQQ